MFRIWSADERVRGSKSQSDRYSGYQRGPFLGERALPIRNYPHIPKANAKIAEETGVKFGASYSALLKDGSFIIDSAAAAAGLISLRSQDEKRGIEFFGRMQEAFYVDGKSLSDFSTYTRIAQDAAIDPAQTQRMLTSGEAATNAHEDFATARKFGADSYPTLLLVKGRRAHPLTTFTTLDVMNRELEVGLRDL